MATVNTYKCDNCGEISHTDKQQPPCGVFFGKIKTVWLGAEVVEAHKKKVPFCSTKCISAFLEGPLKMLGELV